MNRCGAFAIALLGVLACSWAIAADNPTVLVISYPSAIQAQSYTLRSNGMRLSAYDANNVLRWTYLLAQSAGSPCEGEAYLAAAVHDDNLDGLINAAQGEQARLYASMRWRDGALPRSAVLALDIGSPGPPRLLWRQDDQSLRGLAELVTAPTPARVRIGRSNRDRQQEVLLLGAGLPRGAQGSAPARDGARLYALDGSDGRLLWSSAQQTRRLADGATADQAFAQLTAAMSGAIAALDLDQDGYADRLYVGDWQAGLWRFDLHNGQSATQLATGAALAQLADPAAPLGRGFIAAPNVYRTAATSPSATAGLALALGSVATGRDAAARQALFVLRDPLGLQTLTQAQFDALPTVHDADLPQPHSDGSSNVDDASAGYKILLGGDQIISASLSSAGLLLYTQVASTQPLTGLRCDGKPLQVTLKVGALDARTGLSVRDRNHDGRVDDRDRTVALPGDWPVRSALQPPLLGSTDPAGCTLALQPIADCPPLPPPRRLYWRRSDAD